MLEKYKVVYKGGQDEIIEKKSRFIATVAPVESEEEALAFIEAMKKKYWDARHNCFAYVIGENSLQDAVMTENLAALPENLCWMFFLGKKSAI